MSSVNTTKSRHERTESELRDIKATNITKFNVDKNLACQCYKLIINLWLSLSWLYNEVTRPFVIPNTTGWCVWPL